MDLFQLDEQPEQKKAEVPVASNSTPQEPSEEEQKEEVGDARVEVEASSGVAEAKEVERKEPAEEEKKEDEEAGRRSTRARTAPNRYGMVGYRAYDEGDLGFSMEEEPLNYTEAVGSKDEAKWKAAMKEEMEAHKENGTWTLMPLPQGRVAIGSKWVFKQKTNRKGRWSDSRRGCVRKDIHSKREWTTMRHLRRC